MQSRRGFVVSSAAALTAAGARSLMGANDRLRLGVIGTGGRGTYVMSLFQKNEDVAVGAMCDVYKPNLEAAVQTNKVAPRTFESYSDYRRVLDRKDIDILLVATPDHWHCPIVID